MPVDHAELSRILGGGRVPGALTREGRVALVHEAAAALLDGRAPRPEAAIFLGSALHHWLARGGSLERDYLRVHQRGSHLTPQRLAALIVDERQARS